MLRQEFVTLIGIIIIFLFLLFGGSYQHESAHRQIAEYHGCTDYIYGFNLSYAFFRCYNYSERTSDWVLQEEYLHSMNEIVGYHVDLVLCFALLLAGLWFVKKDLQEESDAE